MDNLDRMPKQGYGFIYRYTFDNGKCYIGQTKTSVNERTKGHVSKTMPVDKAIRSGMKFEIEILAEVPLDILDSVERYCIGYFGTLSPNGFNLILGGQTYREYSKEVCEKISLSNKGRMVWNKGIKMSSEQKSKRCAWVRTHKMFGENNPFYNRKHTDETRRKMSERKKEYLNNSENLKNMAERLRKYYDEHPEKIEYQRTIQRQLKIDNGDTKPILCLETKIRYDSIAEASRETGIHLGSISFAVNGKRLSAGGYHWVEYSESNMANADTLLEELIKKDKRRNK